MENYQATLETLNDLVEINNDRIAGYEKALKDIEEDHAELKQLFVNNIGQSHQFKIELGTEIQALGKDIENHTTASGNLHRAWLEVKQVFSGHSAKAILDECEFGEDAIKKAYNTALNEDHLPAYIKDILRNELQVLEGAHDEVKRLRDSL
jgi:uncharacterized protein (TIGR02284 family)